MERASSTSSSSSSSAYQSNPDTSSSISSSSSSQAIDADRIDSDPESFKSKTPTRFKPSMQLGVSQEDESQSITQSFSSSSPSSSSNPIGRPKTLNRMQSKGLTLSIPTTSTNPSSDTNPQSMDELPPPATPSTISSSEPLINSDQINPSPKKQRKRPVKLSLKPIGISHDLSKSVPNSPLDSKLVGSSNNPMGPVGNSSNRNSYYQESKDLRDTLRGTPRRRPSMPFANKT